MFSVLLVGMSNVYAAEYAIFASLDSHKYLPGEYVNLTGEIYSGTTLASDVNVGVSIYFGESIVSSDSAKTDSSGSFSFTFTDATANKGDYTVNITVGSSSVVIPYTVSSAENFMLILVNETIPVSLAPFSLNDVNSGNIVFVDSSIDISSAVAKNFTYNNTEYWVLLPRASSGKYEEAFIDDDANFSLSSDSSGSPVIKYLKEGSKVKLSDKNFIIAYIDPFGSEIIFAEDIPARFSGGEDAKLLCIATNASGGPVSDENLTLKKFYDNGTIIKNYGVIGVSNSGGYYIYSISVDTDGGRKHYILNDAGHASYEVSTYTLNVLITDSEGNPAYVVKPGQDLNITVSILDSSNQPISNTWVNVSITGTEYNSRFSMNLPNGTITQTISAPTKPGSYTLEFISNYNGEKKKIINKIVVKQYNLFIAPLAKGKGASQGFAPGEYGAIFVAATDLSTGDFLNLSDLTGDGVNVSLEGFYDSSGNNKFTGDTVLSDTTEANVSQIIANGNAAVMNISGFFHFLTDTGEIMPEEEQTWLEEKFGEKAIVIIFQAPFEEDTYKVKVSAIIEGTDQYAFNTIGVQRIFVWGEPVDAESKSFTWGISPGSDICLNIRGYDPGKGPIDGSKINDATLIEVIAESGASVTSSMVNENFTKEENNAYLCFTVNDSEMGGHFVRFRVNATVEKWNGTEYVQNYTTAIGDGWFQEKLYQVWAYPYVEGSETDGGRKAVFGSNSNIILRVEVRNAQGGQLGQTQAEGITVSLVEVRNDRTWQTVDATASSTTTDSNGTATLNISKTSGSWSSGGYVVKVKIVDTNDQTDYGYGWFEIRNFNFWAWTNNWEVSLNKDISVTLETKEFNFTGISATITAERLMYMGTFDKWQPPVLVNDSLGVTGQTDSSGSGSLTIPAGTLKEEGQYMLTLKATTTDGRTDNTDVWFYAKSFVLDVRDENQDTWPPRYGLTDIANITVRGYEDYDFWSGSGGTPHNLSSAWVKSVRKFGGMFEEEVMDRKDLENNNDMKAQCSGNTCYLTFNMTNFRQGEYILSIAANDSNGRTATLDWFNIRVERLSISLPDLMRKRVQESNKLYRKVNFSLMADGSSVPRPSGITSTSKYDAIKVLDVVNNSFEYYPYPETHFLLVYKDANTGTPALYVNTTGNNFTNAPKYYEGDVFTDAYGFRWNITKLDATNSEEGKVTLKSIDGVVATRDEWSQEKFLIQINLSLSKSGIFLRGENLWDDEWRNIDLNGDGDYDYNDQYLVILADTQEAGKYDRVYISNTTNFTRDGIDASSGSPITFGSNMPIYLVNLRYYASLSGATNYYEVSFTSNTPSWWGVDLGTFRPGSIIRVPVMITAPGNKSQFINATVRVDNLIAFDFSGPFGGIKKIPLDNPAINSTNWSGKPGILVLDINTSGIKNGEYRIPLKVQEFGATDWVVIDDIWQYPVVQLRTFIVNGKIGDHGRITNLREWSVKAGNLRIENADMVPKSGTLGMEHMGWAGLPDMFHVWDWEFRDIWYNSTNGSIYIDNTPGDSDISDGNYTHVNYTTQSIHGMNVKNISVGPVNVTISLNNGSGSTEFWNFNFTITNADPSTGTATVTIINLQYNFREANNELTSVGENIGYTDFRLIDVTSSSAVIEWNRPVIVLDSPWEVVTEGEAIIRKLELNDTHTLLIYNSPDTKTAEDLQGWYGTMDTVAIGRNIDGKILKTYSIGEPIPELNDNWNLIGSWAVIQARPWEDKVYLSNLTINSRNVYPLPWVADDYYTFYFANFTESSVKSIVNWYLASLRSTDGPPQLDNTTQYYALFFDGTWDGVGEITNAIVDDDTILDEQWVDLGGDWAPYDFDQVELGNSDGYMNFSERWHMIGEEWGEPQMVSIDLDNKVVDTFSEKWDIESGTNVTLWVTAKDLYGKPINGTVSIKEVIHRYWDYSGPVEEKLNQTASAPIIKGVGYLTLDFTNASWGDYSYTFLIQDNEGNKETLKRGIFVMSEEEMFGPAPGECPPDDPTCGGGGEF